jgi:hypothetical protein
MKKYWNILLNWLIPNRRQKLLTEMIRKDQEDGLYDETFKEKGFSPKYIQQPFSVTFSHKEEYITVKLDNGEDVLKLAQIFSDMLSNNNIPNKIIKNE